MDDMVCINNRQYSLATDPVHALICKRFYDRQGFIYLLGNTVPNKATGLVNKF